MDARRNLPLADIPQGEWARVRSIRGERSFRRRLLELGFVPGTPVRIVGVAPLGDPLKLEIRNCTLSVRRAEAQGIFVAA